MNDWHPDSAVTDGVLQGRTEYTELDYMQRRWVVAELTHRGFSVRNIASHLGCSGRQVNRLRADPLAQVMRRLLEERARAEVAVAAGVSAGERATVAEQRAEALQAALDPRVAEVMRRAVGGGR